MTREHHYELGVRWTGNTGAGTASPRAYSRGHDVTAAGPGTLLGSSDPAFRGDATRWNPEQLFVASLAQCHMLWYLGLAASTGVVVTDYEDSPTATMIEESDGSGQFAEVTLHPRVTVTDTSDRQLAHDLHDRVGDYCFIARSVSVPLHHEVRVIQLPGSDAVPG